MLYHAIIPKERRIVKLLIINNLAAGFGDGAVYDFIRAFIKDGDEVTMRASDGTTDIRSQLLDVEDYDLVVAAGGDGTVAAVCYELRGTGIPVLPYPCGTANLLSLNIASPNEPHALAKLAREGHRLSFDLGQIEINGNTYGFGIMAGAGYDAVIMKGAKPHKQLLGPLAYFKAAVSNITPQHSHFTLTLDGQTVESDGVGILLVNFSKLQFDLSVTHKNQPRDGILDVVVLKAENAVELLPAVGAILLDRDGGYPKRPEALELFRAKEVTVQADPPLQLQFDGEVTGESTPFTARILPGAIDIAVSDEGFELFASEEEKAAQES